MASISLSTVATEAVEPAPMPMVKPVAAEPVELVVAVEKVMVLPLTTSVEPLVIAVPRSFEVVPAVPTSSVELVIGGHGGVVVVDRGAGGAGVGEGAS